MKVIEMDITVSLRIFFNQRHMKKPNTTPRRGPPNDILTKLVTTPTAVAASPLARLKNNMKKTMAVPSLSKDYPSTRRLKCTLAPSSFKRATTATGSVAERTHPRVSASYQERSSSP